MILLLFLFVGLVAGIGLALRPRFNSPVRSDRYMPRPPGTLTFNKDVAPIIFDRCAYCHRPGQTAPFTLLNYADVKKHVNQIAEVTAKGYMPPWLPEPGFGDFTDVRRLTAEQLGVLQQWIAEGAVEGDPDLCWTRVPRRHRLRRLAVFVTDAPKLSLAGRSAAPIGLSALRGDDQVAARRDAGIDRQRLERGEEVRLGDVAGSGLHEFRAP